GIGRPLRFLGGRDMTWTKSEFEVVELGMEVGAYAGNAWTRLAQLLKGGRVSNPAPFQFRSFDACDHPRLRGRRWCAAVELWLPQLPRGAGARRGLVPVVRGGQRGRRSLDSS